jgi:AcrR family transcriptional regulator
MDIMSASDSSATTQVSVARSDSTRARVLDGAVACIAAEGFQGSNLGRIARYAGMTTGAIQHQFGDKASLLAEVVERGYERMVDTLARLPGGALPLEARVSALVGALWEGYDASSTRASIEILLAMRGDDAFQRRSLAFLAGMNERIDRLWMGTFWDLEIERARHVEAQRMLFTTLNGLALERILVPGMTEPERDIAPLIRRVLDIVRGE